jgi:hypothetical protein
LNLPINVTVAEGLSYTETFNVTLYANTTVIGTETDQTMNSQSSMIIPFNWKPSQFGNYTLSATVTFTGPTTSTFTTPAQLEVTIQGDVLGKHQVNILDVVAITGIYGLSKGNPKFNPNCDIEGDGKITILDVVACTSHYGQKW